MQVAPHFPWLSGLTYAQTDRISFTLRRDVNPIASDPDADLISYHCLILPIVRPHLLLVIGEARCFQSQGTSLTPDEHQGPTS
jgi:hypothetical protein